MGSVAGGSLICGLSLYMHCTRAPSWRNFAAARAAMPMAATPRMAARLADLSHAQLVEIAAAGCEASTEVKNRAEQHVR